MTKSGFPMRSRIEYGTCSGMTSCESLRITRNDNFSILIIALYILKEKDSQALRMHGGIYVS
jgi:hypothetical protein